MVCRIACVAIAFILTHSGFQAAQQVRRLPSKPTSASQSQTDTTWQQRERAICQIRNFAERVLSFQDTRTKALTLARLADLLWPCDEPFARDLFLKAIDLSTTKKEGSAVNSKAVTALTGLRREVISRIARRDPALAQRLTEADTDGEDQSINALDRMQTNFAIANVRQYVLRPTSVRPTSDVGRGDVGRSLRHVLAASRVTLQRRSSSQRALPQNYGTTRG